ncbi:MAG: hypothetical protein AAGC64_10830 [Bacteroidota bacterium]
MRHFKISKTLFVIIPLFIDYKAQGQVDQQWLSSWNKADEMKPSTISSMSRIAPKSEPGIPLIIKGKIFNPDNIPAKGVVVHAYHRDAQGYDFGENDSSFPTWRLQGWAKTDMDGNFKFSTIRPAPDHLGREGAHIHFTTISNEFGLQWAPKVFLGDDPEVTKNQRLLSKEAGKFGWVCEVKTINGIQYIELNIKLKENGDF